MKRLRIGVAVIYCVWFVSAAAAGDPLGVGEASQAIDMIARDVGTTASMASKAAAEALLAPSNTRKFAKAKAKDGTKGGSDSVGGNAAVLAAGGESADGIDAEPAVPLPVRKPKKVYGSAAKTGEAKIYETAGAKSKQAEAAPVAGAKDKTVAKAKSGAGGDAQRSQSAPADAAKDQTDAKAGTKDGDKPGADKPGTKDKKELTEWPAVDIELAKARCTQLLKGLDAVTVAEAAFRSGECGAPAPVRLVSIGKNPEVAFSPPALVTCDMVVGLHKWIKGDLQALARKHLGAEIVRIDTMSDYSCRRAYGRIANRLSEHGKANALDIRGFITANAKPAYVLDQWGPTRRDVLAQQIALAKAQAIKDDAARLAADKAAQENLRDPKAAASGSKEPQPPTPTGYASGAPAGGIARTTIIDGLPKLTVTLPGGKSDAKSDAGESAMGLAPQHLGGPKEADDAHGNKAPTGSAKAPDKNGRNKTSSLDAIPYPEPRTSMSRFLHDAHVAACRIFGTTLGPEANEAHRNHFHVDMAERKVTKICE